MNPITKPATSPQPATEPSSESATPSARPHEPTPVMPHLTQKENGVRALGLFEQMWLLWGMRMRVVSNRGKGHGPVATAAGVLALASSGTGAAAGIFRLFAHPGVSNAPLLELFLFQLLGFLVAVMWILWPIVTAGVDDSAELSRFATMPVAPWRLFLASTLAALVEPRTLVFYPVLFAAVLGFTHAHHVAFPWVGFVVGTLPFALFNVAWGRVGMTATLNVLRHRRSAEILGGGVLVALFLCALVPPLDTSWITASAASGSVSVSKMNLEVIEAAVLFFSALPSGSWAISILTTYRHLYRTPVILAVYLFSYAATGFTVAFALLLRFYANTARSGRSEVQVGQAKQSFTGVSTFGVLVEREARDLLHNPKMRMLCALPFFLTILLKLVQARDVIRIIGGAHTDVWIIVLLTTYGGVVLAANFAQNAFAYDGQGLLLLFAAPIPLRLVLVAKNVVHGLSSLFMGLLLMSFYAFYVHLPSLPDALAAVATLLLQVVLILAVGNVLSVIAPRKFHAGLQRRDRVPPLTTGGGILAAVLALAPLKLVLSQLPGHALTLPWALGLLASVVLAVGIYLLGLGPTLDLFERRREDVLRAITRE
jgi:ABC-2 type transport system permease protein